MSELDAKLATHVPGPGVRARATLRQLRERRGFLGSINEGLDNVLVLAMGTPETWKRISGGGEAAIYEKEDE